MDDEVPGMVIGDVTRFRQVLVNLLSNGIKFTATGEVVVHVKLLSRPAKGPLHLHFSVADTGIGIPVDRLARLFKSFSQADASTTRHYGGTGLGLAISKRLVELMGGKMWVESVPQKGSTFYFTLSLEPSGLDAPLNQVPQPQLSELRLLVVDDNPTNCRLLMQQTGKWGMQTRSTQSAAQALEWLRSGEAFDIALLDMQMPAMDGLMLASEIRKLPGRETLPLILLTSMGMRRDHPDLARNAFASCLTKPIKPAQLQQVLLRVLSGTKPVVKTLPTNHKLDPTLAQRLPLRVLLCDDNAVNQKVALRLLQQMGYRADLAANGVEALAALDRQQYDLIFMDVMMPEMGGLEATRLIRQRQQLKSKFPNYKSSIIVVAMTANAMQGDREKCLGAGMDDYIAKPVRIEDVRAIVERWGAAARASEAGIKLEMAPECTEVPEQKAPSPGPIREAPVDMARLLEFTDGSAENLRELVTLYLDQTSEQMEQLETAIGAGETTEVRRLAHSCAGASSTCGMRRLVPLLREMETQGMEGKLTTAAEIWEDANREFAQIRTFLEAYLASHSGLVSKP
jgi:CheY-like chemotaxis protein/HPt (histidine-containing phosphotransfer) domain-containing protein